MLDTAAALLLLWPGKRKPDIRAIIERAALAGSIQSYRAGQVAAASTIARLSKEIGTDLELVGLPIPRGELAKRALAGAEHFADAFRDGMADKREVADQFGPRAAAKQVAEDEAYRLRRLAATENSVAFNEARQSEVEASVKRAGVDPKTVTRIWHAELDACEKCNVLNGDEAALNGSFPSGEEPGAVHANCRCTTEFRYDG